MASNTLSASFKLFATSDGSTISGSLRVDGYPLVQRYTAGTEKYVPDFAALPEADRPTIYPVLRDQSTAAVLTPNTYEWRYNDVLLAFGADGLSTNSGMAGLFKRIDNYQASIGGQTFQLQALRVMGNLASATNHDNDRITLGGTVEAAGSSVAFADLAKDVVIQESTGNQYSAAIVNDAGSALTDEVTTLTESLQIYKDGVLLTDTTGVAYQWYVLLPSGKQNLGTAATQAVGLDDVDGSSVIGCDISVAGSVVASAYDLVTDYTDPYLVQFAVTGMTGDRCRPGETPTVTPAVYRRSDPGTPVSGLVSTWSWAVYDNTGAPFTLSGKQGATFQAASVTTSYNELRSASGALGFIVSAEYEL